MCILLIAGGFGDGPGRLGRRGRLASRLGRKCWRLLRVPIRSVHDGQVWHLGVSLESLGHRRDQVAIDDLSPRETDILEQMAIGLSNKGIAAELAVSIKTIEKSVTTIFRKVLPIGPADRDESLIDRRVTAVLPI